LCVPVVPVTQEAKEGGSLKPRSSRPAGQHSKILPQSIKTEHRGMLLSSQQHGKHK
jgi:hypothetical protein